MCASGSKGPEAHSIRPERPQRALPARRESMSFVPFELKKLLAKYLERLGDLGVY